MNRKVEAMIEQLDGIRFLFDEGAFVSVLDTDARCLALSAPEGFVSFINIGERIDDPNGAFQRCISTGTVQHNILPKEVVGMDMEGNLVPIKDGGEVVGVIASSFIVDDKQKKVEVEKAFRESMVKVNSSVDKVMAAMNNLTDDLSAIIEATSEIGKDVTQATKVVTNVGKNASRSNILALNASIEAARSGEAGRGFAVVATEMGKLATESSTSATEIRATLDGIVEHLEAITDAIKTVGDEAEYNKESIQAINNILDEAFEKFI